MPWACTTAACEGRRLQDDVTSCPACGLTKQAWTLGQATRHFVVGKRRKVECRGGSVLTTRAGAPAPHVGVAWPVTDSAAVVSKEEARRRMQARLLPDPRDLLAVRVRPAAGQAQWRLSVAVCFAGRSAEEQTFDLEPRPERLGDQGELTAHLLCVDGPGDASDLAFRFVHVVDVSEATDLGHAPTLRVSFTRHEAASVALARRGLLRLRVQLHDRAWRPCARAAYALIDAAGARTCGVTDPAGWLEALVAPGEQRVELDEGRLRFKVRAGVSRDDDDAWCVARLRDLGFVAPRPSFALNAFQVARGLEPTGLLDGPTRQAIHDAIEGGDGSLADALGKAQEERA